MFCHCSYLITEVSHDSAVYNVNKCRWKSYS